MVSPFGKKKCFGVIVQKQKNHHADMIPRLSSSDVRYTATPSGTFHFSSSCMVCPWGKEGKEVFLPGLHFCPGTGQPESSGFVGMAILLGELLSPEASLVSFNK